MLVDRPVGVEVEDGAQGDLGAGCGEPGEPVGEQLGWWRRRASRSRRHRCRRRSAARSCGGEVDVEVRGAAVCGWALHPRGRRAGRGRVGGRRGSRPRGRGGRRGSRCRRVRLRSRRSGRRSGRTAARRGCPASSCTSVVAGPLFRGAARRRAWRGLPPRRRGRGRGRSRAGLPAPAGRRGPARSWAEWRRSAGPRTARPRTLRSVVSRAISRARHTGTSPAMTRSQSRGSRWASSRASAISCRAASWLIPSAAARSAGANSATHGAPGPASGTRPSPCRSASPQWAGVSSVGQGCSRAHSRASSSCSTAACCSALRAARTRSITSVVVRVVRVHGETLGLD